MNREIESGQLVLMIKNEDGTFSPVGLSRNHAAIIQSFLAKLSESEPLVRDSDKYIKKN